MTPCCIRGRCWRAYSHLKRRSIFSATLGCACGFSSPAFYCRAPMPMPTPHAYTSILYAPHAQASDPQERNLQLPRDHPQPADPAHPAKDVARERRELPRAALLHAVDEAPRVGGPLPAAHRAGRHGSGQGAVWGLRREHGRYVHRR